MDKITTKKIDSFTLEVTKEIPAPEVIKTTYERSFIEQQIINIQKQKDDFDALRDKELAECQGILKAMDKLKIVVKPMEETTEQPVLETEPVNEDISDPIIN